MRRVQGPAELEDDQHRAEAEADRDQPRGDVRHAEDQIDGAHDLLVEEEVRVPRDASDEVAIEVVVAGEDACLARVDGLVPTQAHVRDRPQARQRGDGEDPAQEQGAVMAPEEAPDTAGKEREAVDGAQARRRRRYFGLRSRRSTGRAGALTAGASVDRARHQRRQARPPVHRAAGDQGRGHACRRRFDDLALGALEIVTVQAVEESHDLRVRAGTRRRPRSW